MKKRKNIEKPSLELLRGELERTKYQQEYRKTLLNTVSVLIVVAALTVLVAMVWLPVLEIYGSSMNPTLVEGDYVVSISAKNPDRGDLVAYYFGNKLLVKRVIGLPGELIDINEEGIVSVDGKPLDEPYLVEHALGECDIELPLEVPQEQYFVLGDRRSTSLDSRNKAMGFIGQDQLVGKVIFRIWPLGRIGQVG